MNLVILKKYLGFYNIIMSDSENVEDLLKSKSIVSSKIMNVILYLQRLNIQSDELKNKNYKQLINDEIDFYKKKLIDYSNLYINIL